MNRNLFENYINLKIVKLWSAHHLWFKY